MGTGAGQQPQQRLVVRLWGGAANLTAQKAGGLSVPALLVSSRLSF